MRKTTTVLVVIFLIFVTIISAFRASGPRKISRSTLNSNLNDYTKSNRPNYKELLEKAKGIQPQSQSQEPPAAAAAATTGGKKQTLQTPREMAQFKNKIPFEEDTYTEIKFVIEVLSARMKDGLPLTREKAQRFEVAIENILSEARSPRLPERQ